MLLASRVLDSRKRRDDDHVDASGSQHGPLVGIRQVPLVGLKDAIDALNTGPHSAIYDLMLGASEQALADGAKKKNLGNLADLTVDEAAAVCLYTMQTPLYSALNLALRDEDQVRLEPLRPYIKLLLTALYKLPIERCIVYRAIKNPPPYSRQSSGDRLVPMTWWSFSSCSRNMQSVERFLGASGPRALFIIENVPCVNIQDLSAFKDESERLILPGTSLRLVSVSSPHDNGRMNVQLEFIKGNGLVELLHPQWPIDVFAIAPAPSTFITKRESGFAGKLTSIDRHYSLLCHLGLKIDEHRLRVEVQSAVRVKHALLISISQYNGPIFPPLSPDPLIGRLATLLNNFGFTVMQLTEERAGRAEILHSLNLLCTNANEEHNRIGTDAEAPLVLVFFGGHGVQIGGALYFAPFMPVPCTYEQIPV